MNANELPELPDGLEGELWPEDVLTEEEWERGWFDRQVIAGKRDESERSQVPTCFGGTRDD